MCYNFYVYPDDIFTVCVQTNTIVMHEYPKYVPFVYTCYKHRTYPRIHVNTRTVHILLSEYSFRHLSVKTLNSLPYHMCYSPTITSFKNCELLIYAKLY